MLINDVYFIEVSFTYGMGYNTQLAITVLKKNFFTEMRN